MKQVKRVKENKMNEMIKAQIKDSVNARIKRLEKAVIECLEIPNSMLPESYRGKRSHRKLSSVVKQAKRKRKSLFVDDPRSVSVKFDSKHNVVGATPERLAVLESYRNAVANDQEIEYNVNERLLHAKEMVFVGAMVKAGLIELDDEE